MASPTAWAHGPDGAPLTFRSPGPSPDHLATNLEFGWSLCILLFERGNDLLDSMKRGHDRSRVLACPPPSEARLASKPACESCNGMPCTARKCK